jgi:hypothetical protein
MATQYSVTLRNQSTRGGTFCLYATAIDPQQAQDDLRSLAWVTHPANPNVRVDFKWLVNYSLSWSQTGSFAGQKVIYIASEDIPADPMSPQSSKAYLDNDNHGYMLLSGDPRARAAYPGALAITCGNNVAPNEAAIGIGINGDPILAVPATPNYIFTFFTNLKYWVAFGDFQQGEVIDVNSMTGIYELDFSGAVHHLDITLDSSNEWNVTTLAQLNERIRKAQK